MREEHIAGVSGLLKSIGHPLRLKILCLLLEGERTVGDIQAAVSTSPANVSQHLAVMRHQGIVAFRKQANFIYNHIADQRVVELMETIQKLYC